MKWMTNLKRQAKEIKEGTYKFYSEFDEKNSYEYYEEQYLMYEKELTFKQSEMVEAALKILREAIKNKYPNVELQTIL